MHSKLLNRMDIRYFVGIDITKLTLDWVLYEGKPSFGKPIPPTPLPVSKLPCSSLKHSFPGSPNKPCFAWNTPRRRTVGIYNAYLLEFLHKAGLAIWLENSTQIKQAGGMQPRRRTGGKSDAVYARRIAEYAYRFRNQMRLWEPPRQIIQQLSFLSAVRQRLTQAYNLLAVPLAEQESFVSAALQKKRQATSTKSLAALKDEQKAIDCQIAALIDGDSRLKELFDLIVSVPGVGPTTATELLVATNEMKTINEPKKMACYAGVAPFVYGSGTSVRGKTRVSHQAQKRLKSLFHLGGMSAIRATGELQDYYQPVRRCGKVKEGKNKIGPPMRLVLNAVRNKLIHRIYAIVKRGEKYDKTHLSPLA